MNGKEQLYQSQVGWRKTKDLNAKRIATRGEDLAVRYLESKSYRVLARNFRAGRAGEIDIIARAPDEILAFIEVKTRTTDGIVYGIPEVGFEAVDYRKQMKIYAVSDAYLKLSDERGRWQYDVIVIGVPRNPEKEVELTHVRNAFGI